VGIARLAWTSLTSVTILRNLVVRFNRHEKHPVTSRSGLNFLKLYPNLNSLFIDWHRLIPSTDLTASSSRTSATPQPLVSTTVELLDIRLTDPAAGVENDGLALARQFTGILLRLQLPSLRYLHVIHNLPEKKTFVQENWETVMAGLRSVDFPKLEVLRVSLWLGQRAHSQKYRLWVRKKWSFVCSALLTSFTPSEKRLARPARAF
jgi:hypothetical protein